MRSNNRLLTLVLFLLCGMTALACNASMQEPPTVQPDNPPPLPLEDPPEESEEASFDPSTANTDLPQDVAEELLGFNTLPMVIFPCHTGQPLIGEPAFEWLDQIELYSCLPAVNNETVVATITYPDGRIARADISSTTSDEIIDFSELERADEQATIIVESPTIENTAIDPASIRDSAAILEAIDSNSLDKLISPSDIRQLPFDSTLAIVPTSTPTRIDVLPIFTMTVLFPTLGEIVSIKPTSQEEAEMMLGDPTFHISYLTRPDDPLGEYLIQLAGVEGGVQSLQIELTQPSGARLYYFEPTQPNATQILLYNFAPSENVRLIVYENSKFVGWQMYQVNSDGSLIIEVDKPYQYYAGIGETSGEAKSMVRTDDGLQEPPVMPKRE